jgi:predicted outer membrane protein
MKLSTLLAIAGAALLVSSGAAAQQVRDTAAAQQVLSRLHRIHQMGIEAGGLAQTHAASADVRALAQQLARFHGQGDARVRAAAAAEHITLVEPMPFDEGDRSHMSAQNAAMNELRNLQGPPFDHAYLTAVIQSRDNALPVLRQILPQVVDQQAKAALSETITQLENQRTAARALFQREFPGG